MKRLQTWMVSVIPKKRSDRNGKPLRRMQVRGVNMQNVRSCLGMKSARRKIQKRVLERIGHVVRIGNEKLTKAMVFGWYKV